MKRWILVLSEGLAYQDYVLYPRVQLPLKVPGTLVYKETMAISTQPWQLFSEWLFMNDVHALHILSLVALIFHVGNEMNDTHFRS